ncbi:MAG: YSC84-related protein [Comamonadaceae bacterium]|nr:YSC84-related protein [Comamonadaceae bacterium]
MMTRPASPFRALALCAAVALGVTALTACTTTGPGNQASPGTARASMPAQVDATLSRLYKAAPGSQELVEKSAGVLVFPQVVGGSLIVGVEHGRGVLRAGGQTLDEYTINAASLGLQAGGQSKSLVYVFNTADALQKFRDSKGWTVGVDATVAAGTLGANGMVDTRTSQQPVVSFVLTNVGLEAGVAVQGAKVTRAAN